MSEYEKQANDFALKHNVELKIIGQPKFDKHFFDDKQNRWIFKVQLLRNGKSYTLNFGQSINAGKKEPTMYDILTCLHKYEVDSFEDFCSEFGYNEYVENDYGRCIQNKNAYKTYLACKKESESVERLFGDVMDELYELYEIN